MAKSLIPTNTGTLNSTIGDGLVRYFLPGASLDFNVRSETEAYAQLPIRASGTLRNLSCYVKTSNTIADTFFTLRKNAADTDLAMTFPSATTGEFEDISEVSIAATDELSLKLDCPTMAGSRSVTISRAGLEYEPDSSGDTYWFGAISGAYSNASTITHYAFITGVNLSSSTWGTTESVYQYRLKAAYTASNLSAYISSNSKNSTCTWGFRKNGSAGNCSVSVTASSTGFFEDTSGTDSLSNNDLINFRSVIAGTGTIVSENVTIQFLSTDGTYEMPMWFREDGLAAGFNQTRYFAFGGVAISFQTAESETQQIQPFEIDARDFGVVVLANTIETTASTATVRVNGADTGLSVSIAAGGTGEFEDTADTISLSVDDLFNGVLTTPNTSGALSLRQAGILFEHPVSGAEVNDERAAETHGQTTGSSTRAAEAHGQTTANAERDAQTTGTPISLGVAQVGNKIRLTWTYDP